MHEKAIFYSKHTELNPLAYFGTNSLVLFSEVTESIVNVFSMAILYVPYSLGLFITPRFETLK